jgi:secondary thiamine-phosphate synthase enzyme
MPQRGEGGLVKSEKHECATSGQGDAKDLTDAVAAAVRRSGFRNGLATICVIGSTAAITTIEFEPGAIADLDAVFAVLAPRDGTYQHHLRWGDDNGSSHVRAALMGPSISIPFIDGALTLGTWQQIMLLECDTRPRRREVVMQMIGE